jgi:SOS response regulatory protein OraA/RecX
MALRLLRRHPDRPAPLRKQRIVQALQQRGHSYAEAVRAYQAAEDALERETSEEDGEEF